MADDPKQIPDELQRYLDEIAKYDREFKKWESRVDKILKKYRDEGRESRTNVESRFNILWSNVQTLVPACFSRLPQPDVSRRFSDTDPVGRVSSLMLERALDFEIQHYGDYRNALKAAVHDRFLGGRGTIWCRYEGHFKKNEATEQIGSAEITEDQENEAQEQLDFENTPVDYVHWRDFGHSVARTWEEVELVWRWVYMGEDAVRDRFGDEIAKAVPYDSTPEDLKKNARNAQENYKKQAKICEIWDKGSGKAVWLSKSYKTGFLDERDDPLGLQDFFPCPKPLYATLTNESLIPVPDYSLYQDQANELDILADRIDGLIKMLQVKGTYDSASPELRRLFSEGENGTLIPVKNFAAFAEKGGLKGGVDIYDLTPLVQALRVAQEGMAQVKQQIYDITGISDIIRGQTEASETATAQQIKGQYAGLRLRAMQQDVASFATDILRIKAQIICAKYSPDTIKAISAADQLSPVDVQVVPQALALLLGEQRMMNPEAEAPNPLRSFRIDVEADTLVQIDEQQEKENRVEFITAVSTFVEKAAPALMQFPQAAPLLISMLKFGVTGFKVGKQIEGEFDTAIDQIKQAAMAPKPPPPPDPALQVAQVKAQADIQKTQMDAQNAREQHAMDKEKHGMEMQKMAAERDRSMQDHNIKLEQMRESHSTRMNELL